MSENVYSAIYRQYTTFLLFCQGVRGDGSFFISVKIFKKDVKREKDNPN